MATQMALGTTKRVLVVVSARPSYARVLTVLESLHRTPSIQLAVVPVASALLHRTGKVVHDIQDHFPTTQPLWTVIEGDTHLTSIKTTGLLAIELGTLFAREAPDVVVTVADRHETLATAMAASYLNIPLVHIQGGEISGNIDNKVRNAITQLADWHFPATTLAGVHVENMGAHYSHIRTFGCPSVDIALRATKGMNPFKPNPPTVVIYHSVTTELLTHHGDVLHTILECIQGRIVVFMPGVDAGSEGIRKEIRENRRIKVVHRYIPPEDVYRLIYQAKMLIGNSSLGIREASALGVPVINVGGRQKGRERAHNVIDVGYEAQGIIKAIKCHSEAPRPLPSPLYGTGDAGSKIAKVIAMEI